MRPPARKNRTANYTKPSPLTALVKTKRTRKPKALKPTTAMVKMIRSVVGKTNETKYVTETLLNPFAEASGSTTPSTYINFNSMINTQNDWYRVLPLVNQGLGAYNRVGDSITPVSLKCTWDLAFSLTSSDANSRDIVVVMYCLRPKQQLQYPAVTANGQLAANLTILDAGNGIVKTYNGNQQNSYYPVDTRNFTVVFKKLIRLYKPFGTQNTNTPPLAAGASVGAAQQVYRKSFSHTWKKLKKLKYDAAAQVPANFGDVWACGYFYTDGSPPDTGGGLLQVGCYSELRYKDE